MTAPQVSVGVPVYDGERFLAETLEALLAQSHDDLEVIVSDNGSTDGTEKIARAFSERDARVVYTRSATNRGMGWNYNRTLELASAELFMWNPADDLAKPDYLQRCVAALRSRPDAVLAYTDVEVVDEQGHLIESLPSMGGVGSDPDVARRIDAFLRAEAWDVVYGVTRTDVLRAVGGMPPMVGDDVVLGVELLVRAPFVHVDGVLFQRRQHARQSSADHDPTAGAVQQDPSAEPWIAMPSWRINAELYKRIATAPVPLAERRAAARAVLAGWTRPKSRRLVGDVRRSAHVARRRLAATRQARRA